MNKNRFDINEEELTLLKELVSIKGKKFEGFDDLGFLKDLPITAYKLPERMLKLLNEFKYDPPKEGYCIVSKGMVDAQ